MNGKKSVIQVKFDIMLDFKVYPLTHLNVPVFTELRVAKFWNHFKNNKTVIEYMPEYEKKQLQERDFFFGVLCTIYPKEMIDLIKATKRESLMLKQF